MTAYLSNKISYKNHIEPRYTNITKQMDYYLTINGVHLTLYLHWDHVELTLSERILVACFV